MAAVAAAAVWTAAVSTARPAASDDSRPAAMAFGNATGVLRTVTRGGAIDPANPFFQDLGTNGRSCATCHRPAQAWTVTPQELQERFEATSGLDPIFRTNDGSTCDGAPIATVEERRAAFSLLLTKGLIRVALDVPEDAEFEIVGVDDPYRCGAPLTSASMFRRPLPSTNLGFLSAVMWDGRETKPGEGLRDALASQVVSAVTGHAQGAAPSPAQMRRIVDLELGLFTAQDHDHDAGGLAARGARGGPGALAVEPFCIGINDPLKLLPATPGACLAASHGLNPGVFTAFAAWSDDESPERRAVARGETIFNTRPFVIDDVAGLNGGPRDPIDGPIRAGTCTVCHNTPNAGNHSISMPLNIGITAASRRTPDLPLYTLRNRVTGAVVQTTDPGRAMITGKWVDIGKFKGPVLRALAARAPYFHDGSAATLADLIAFYDTRFHIGLSDRDKADLLAFLRAL